MSSRFQPHKETPGVCSWRELLNSYDGEEECTGNATVRYIVEFEDGRREGFCLCEPCADRIEREPCDPRIRRQFLARTIAKEG